MPQRPITTDGTAASISTSDPIGPRIDGGASSLRKSPIAIESGAASTSAPKEVTSVPRTNCAAPNCEVTGFQALDQRNESPNSCTAGQAPETTFQATATTSAIAASVASAVSAQKARSPIRSVTRRVRGRTAGVSTVVSIGGQDCTPGAASRARSPLRHRTFTRHAPRPGAVRGTLVGCP